MESWERVQIIMEREGLNKNSFSEAIGLSSNVTITRLINEQRRASPTTCKKIIERFPNYNYEWLLNGAGNMLKEADNLNQKDNSGTLETYNNSDPGRISAELKDFFSKRNITQEDIARDLGVSQAYVSAMLNGKPFGKNTAKKWSELYKIQPSWLLTGKGDMLKDTEKVFQNIHPNSLDTYRLVPLVNMDAVGGMDSLNEVVLTDAEYLIGHIAFNDALEGDLCMPVSGNSMTPTCPAGSIVLVREVLDWTEYFGFGNIFVLLLRDGRRIIKEVTRYEDNPRDYILCVSHNASVPSEELPKKLINRVWKVIKILVNEGW